MKGFLTLFYTRPAKTFYLIIILVLSFLVGECQVRYFEHFSSDRESFINAITQIDSFEYEKSYFFRNTVTNAIEGVVELAMEYPQAFEQGTTADELISYFDSIGDKKLPDIIRSLKDIKGFRFAVVDHGKGVVYSNIPEINGADSGENVRKSFGEPGKNLLVARSCKNPYFAKNNYIDFADPIRDCAAKYQDNFDLYIRFGSLEEFDERAEVCRQKHFEMRSKIEKLNDSVAICLVSVVLVMLVMLIVTGKHEPKGKTYLTAMNRIPGDLLVVIYAIVLYCIVALYRTSATVVINHGMELDTLWFMRSEEFYISRIKYCVVIIICVVVNLMCVLKRSYKTGILLSNTYLYPLIKNFIKRYSKKKPKEEENTERS